MGANVILELCIYCYCIYTYFEWADILSKFLVFNF